MSNNKTFLSNITDADINETLQHYGKVIGVDIVVGGDANFTLKHNFILNHDGTSLYVCNADGLELRRFALPIPLHELGEFLLNSNKEGNNLLNIGVGLSLDIAQRIILHDGKAICELTEKESEMLGYIAIAGDAGADKDELLKHVWGYHSQAKSRTIEAHLYRLRQKLLEIAPANTPTITVIEGRCYLGEPT